MKVLMTGASGFIGSALCSFLSNRGVTAIPITRWELTNINSPAEWETMAHSCSTVLHLAALTGAENPKSGRTAENFKLVNVDITLSLAKRAFMKGIRRFVFMSSIKVNGDIKADNASFKHNDKPNPHH